MECPFVSVVTPTTKSRQRFIDLMFANIKSQTYPHDRMEWLVVGDAEMKESFTSRFLELCSLFSCRYVVCNIENDIGKKRNFACSQSRFKILASMDDDDVYHKDYLKYSISEMNRRNVNMVGCRDMLVFFPLQGGKMRFVRGASCHEATIVCRKKHWKMFKYREQCSHGEGSSMVAGSFFNALDITKIMICVAHTCNTYDKTRLLSDENSKGVVISREKRESLLNLIGEFCSPRP